MNKYLFILSGFVWLTGNQVFAQKEYDVIRNNWIQFSDAPNALYHHFASQAYALLDNRKTAIHDIRSLHEWQNRQQYIKKTLLELAGPFPEKSALNARTVKTISREDYRIEHIIYESVPGFYVTSSLFIPTKKIKKKLPAIIYCSGHASEGYRSTTYQHIILNLVKKGFIVFAFDPVGQGERLQYLDITTGKSMIGGPVAEHSYPGAQEFLAGNSQAKYMIWDGMRALDYLLTRKEVDPQQIGITGRSGGGTQSAYIAAIDERIKAAAPECYVTNFTRLIQSIGPQDAEQNLDNAILRGMDHADFLLVRAPKPSLMVTTTRDIFSIEGARETAKEVARIYKAYNKEDCFEMVEDDAPHASTQKNREAMYTFFQKHLNNPGVSHDEKTDTLTAQELQVTINGQIGSSFHSETIFSLNQVYADSLFHQLQNSRKSLAAHLDITLQKAIQLSGYESPSALGKPVFTGRIQQKGYVVEKYFIKGEGDYVIPYLLIKPDQSNRKALIYLHPLGKQADLTAGGEIEWFVKNGFTVLAPDLIGIGEMGPGVFFGDSFIKGVSYNVWYASMLVGRSIVGVRSADVIRLARSLLEDKNIQDVYGMAKKEMAPVLLHAAAFEPLIKHIALVEPYISYRAIVMNRFYKTDFVHSFVPKALTGYDLPDLAATLAPRSLLIVNATDGEGKVSDPHSFNEDIEVIKSAYQYRNADTRFEIIHKFPVIHSVELYENWIK